MAAGFELQVWCHSGCGVLGTLPYDLSDARDTDGSRLRHITREHLARVHGELICGCGNTGHRRGFEDLSRDQDGKGPWRCDACGRVWSSSGVFLWFSQSPEGFALKRRAPTGQPAPPGEEGRPEP
jgi:hypothetical protein